MKIERNSTVTAILDKNSIEASSEDLQAWNRIALPNTTISTFSEIGVSYDISLGLFGIDLLNFFMDCRIATKYCDYKKYN
jgi:hypothetical protein